MPFAQIIRTNTTQGQTDFSFTFPFIKEEHIKLFVNFVEITQGTGSSEFQVITNVTPNVARLNTGLASANTRVEVRRVSSINTVLVDFEDGSTLTAADLDTNSKQSLFIAQELDDAQKQGLSIDVTTGVPSLNNQLLSNVLDPVNAQDAVTKAYLERSGSISSTQILNGTIVNDDINASASIAGTKISPNFGSQNIITTGTVDGRDVSVDGTKLDTVETNAKDDQTAAEIKILLQSNKITDSEIETGTLDNRYYTEAEADARFYNVGSLEEIQSGETWTAADNKVATTAAIDARVIDLVDDVGGFVPIANELSFPNTNPDINNGAGTLVSIKGLSTAYTSDGGGQFTIANGTIGNSTVTITGATASTTFAAGFGMILETTTTLNTYTFHRLVPKATEVTTVAGSIANVNTVAGISSNVTTVAGVASSVPTVANIASNVTTVAGVSSNVTTVAGISANVTTVAGISSNVTTVANDGTDIGTVAGSISNVNTVAGDITNVNNVGGSISNVNTVATNITNVTNASNFLNNFLQLYLGEASSDPTVDGLGNVVTEGDLYFNTVDKRVRVFNGSVFQNLAEGAVEVAKFATAAFNALYTASAGSNSIDLGGLAITGAVFSNEAIATNRVSLGKGSGTFNLGGI